MMIVVLVIHWTLVEGEQPLEQYRLMEPGNTISKALSTQHFSLVRSSL